MKLEDFDNDEDKIIQDKLKQKTWNEVRANDSWAIFKIMAEFVNGYESMSRIGPCVTIFGFCGLNGKMLHIGSVTYIAYHAVSVTNNMWGVLLIQYQLGSVLWEVLL